MKSVIPLLAILILSGCAGPMDYVSPGLQVSGTLDRQVALYSIQPYNKRHMKQILNQSTPDEFHRPKEAVAVSESGDFEINVYGFRRGGLFWVIPPLGGIGLDYKAEVILEVEDQAPRGIIMGKEPEVYVYDPEKNKVVIDESGFIDVVSISETTRTVPYPWSGENQETVDKLNIKINVSKGMDLTR